MARQDAEDSQRLTEQQIEAERMRDVLVLIIHLTKSQEATVTMILDCLYDVGAANLINQKLHSRSLNGLAKLIARNSKPVFRLIALRWFQKNCPQLITRWLHGKVKFAPPKPKAKPVVPAATVPAEMLVAERRETQRLRTQVRYLTGVSVGAIATLVVVFLWLGLNPERPLEFMRQVPVTTREDCLSPGQCDSP